MIAVKTKRANGLVRVQMMPEGESLVEQSHKDECNINTIMAKAKRGIPPKFMRADGQYGDFSEIGDYQQSLYRVHEADRMFQSLPSNIRKMFNNDVATLLAYLNNPENEQEAIELGLVPRPVQPEGSNEIGDSEPTEPSTEADG